MEFMLEALWIVLGFVLLYVYCTGKRWWAWGLLEGNFFKYMGGIVITVTSVLLILRLYCTPLLPSTK